VTFTTACYVGLVACVLANSGCLLIAAGAAGGAAVGYAYCKGKVVETYNATLGDSLAATRTALAELGMPLVHEEPQKHGAIIETRTADGDRVRIHLETLSSPIPAEGELTRIGVRVATFGDHHLSDRILDQIGLHLAPAHLVAPPPNATAPPPAASLGVVQTQATTQAPPLATPGQANAPPVTSSPPILPSQPVPAGK
jgi:hypothetical protein